MHGSTPKVVVIGGTYVDMSLRCGHVPGAGEDVHGFGVAYSITGPGPNQAAEVALCGCDVHLISKVGGDAFGRMAIKSIAELNVNTDYVYMAQAKNTGVIVTLVDGAGDNASCSYVGANTALRPQEVQAADSVIGEAAVCLIHGRLPQETIATAIRCAEMHGTKVILNPARPIQPNGKELAFPAEYFSSTVLIPNLYEAAEIAEQSTVNICDVKMTGSDLVARGAEYAVITMGRRGCMVVDRGGADHIQAFEVEVVDQAGRGDAFAGALAAFYAVKDDVREGAKFASAAGALACTKFGSIEAMPKKAEIIELLQKEDMGYVS